MLRTADHYEQLARDFVEAFGRDNEALRRLNQGYGRAFTFEDLYAEVWRRVYAFRQRSSRVENNTLLLAEAQMVIAQDAGFPNWEALVKSTETGAEPVPAHVVDGKERVISPRRRLNDSEWEALLAEMKENRIARLDANGLMTDAILRRVAELDHVTDLSLGGSRELSDDGLKHLARMPGLRRLNLSEYPGGKLTDNGLEVLRHLPNLREFEMTWQSGITDAGVAKLRFCPLLESVNLMGTPTGDGAIDALQGKRNLRSFNSGRLVTDKGLAMLQNFPRFKNAPPSSSEEKDFARLLIDGPFTNQGLASVAGLDGVAELDLFWHVKSVTSQGFVHLGNMLNLRALAADGSIADNVALKHFAAIPQLRKLRIQETPADDDGFVSLSKSKTLEGIWGRHCKNLRGRGFLALSKMPALRSLGVSCKNVDDTALAALPQFPSLRELTPIDVKDAGFRHIGLCHNLERLSCMYCRETTDAATEHIANLRIKYYYAGLTLITDRSLEILGGMPSLEQIEFFECNGVTDAGLKFVAGLPRLREVALDSLPGVTLAGARALPAHVHVRYTT